MKKLSEVINLWGFTDLTTITDEPEQFHLRRVVKADNRDDCVSIRIKDLKSWVQECIKELEEEQEIAYEEYDDGLTNRYEIQRVINFLEKNVLEVEE